MYKAIDDKGNIIYANKTTKSSKCFCLDCKEVVYLKCGKLRKPHFAHKNNIHCSKTTNNEINNTQNEYKSILNLWNDNFKWMLIEDISGYQYIIFEKPYINNIYGYPPNTKYEDYLKRTNENCILINNGDLPIWKIVLKSSKSIWKTNKKKSNIRTGYTVNELIYTYNSNSSMILECLPFNMYFYIRIDRDVRYPGDIITIPYQYIPNTGELIELKEPSTYHEYQYDPIWIKTTMDKEYNKDRL